MFQTLSDKSKALILALLIITGSVVAAWLLSGWELALLIAGVQITVIWIAKSIWITDKSNFLLRGAVLTIVSGVVLLGNAWWQPLVSNLVHQYFPNLPLPDYSVSPITLLFLLILVTIVFYYTRPEPVIEKPEKKIADLIEGPTIKQKWESICESLSASIRDIDRATNWSHEYYTPLDAEVEMKTSNRTNKVVKDLLEAIKESNDRLFLLVGDPGAGKSVALRKLCLDILKDSVKREYIPIYVNLKEWTDTKDWTIKPPTWQDLRNFIKQSLLQKDPYLADFFEKYYDVLDENGNLFFVLDSFDEIPQVLGTTADAKLIEDLSIVCRDFLKGSKQKRSKGILASREYRMPRQEYLEANTKLTVRPFTFEKIEQSLTQSNKVSKETVEKLLRERPELIPSLRNPFISSLLKAYLTDNNNQFPKNQADLFENYIHKAIQKAQARKGLTDIPFDDILSVTIQIAKTIFSESGLQAPLSILRQQIAHPHFDNIVEIMRYTRIARGDSSNTSEFSFSHRRFYEYFVVQDILKVGKADLPLENIPTDSRWRDTLVLYCEVAPFEEAQKIANYCWFDVIQPNNDISNRASKHCLRFLIEAFRGRQECLVDFHEELSGYVLEQIHVGNDPIDIKLAVEALGILDIKNLDDGTIKALNLKDAWINDTAMRSCRHLAYISKELEIAILNTIDFYTFEKKQNKEISKGKPNLQMSITELEFSLKLSNVFKHFIPIVKWQNKKIKYKKYLLIISLISSCFFSLFLDFQSSNKILPLYLLKPLYYAVSFFNLFLLFFVFGNAIIYVLELIYLNKSKYFKNRITKKSLIKDVKVSLIVVTVVFITISVFSLASKIFNFHITTENGYKVFLVILIIFIVTWLILYIFNYLLLKKVNSEINQEKISDRDYIATIFNRLSIFSDDTILNYFLTNLENNIKRVHGIYPKGFLKVGKSAQMTRLIQLEERWREAEEREAEQQNTPKPKTYPKTQKTIKDLVRDNTLTEAIAVALKKTNLSKDDENALILLQSRLVTLEKGKDEGTIENEAYHARLTELKKALLNLSDE